MAPSAGGGGEVALDNADADEFALASVNNEITPIEYGVTEWSDLTWSEIGHHLTTSRNLPATFWLSQALFLIVMALTVWGTASLWEKYCDTRAGRIVDKYLDLVELVAWPATRLLKRALAAAARNLPIAYQGERGHWRLLGESVAALCVSFLVLQFYCVAYAAATSMGPHRSELPTIATGAARLRWSCSCVRLRGTWRGASGPTPAPSCSTTPSWTPPPWASSTRMREKC